MKYEIEHIEILQTVVEAKTRDEAIDKFSEQHNITDIVAVKQLQKGQIRVKDNE